MFYDLPNAKQETFFPANLLAKYWKVYNYTNTAENPYIV